MVFFWLSYSLAPVALITMGLGIIAEAGEADVPVGTTLLEDIASNTSLFQLNMNHFYLGSGT